MKVRLVVLPEYKLSLLARGRSEKLATVADTLFTLDTAHIPHITITTIHIENELSQVLNLTKDLSQELSRYTAKALTISHDKEGYVSLKIEKTPELLKLHKRSLQIFGEEYTVKLDPFIPHVTLTRCASDSEAIEKSKTIRPIEGSFTFNYLAICKSGENGTCTKIIKKCRLRLIGGETNERYTPSN